MYDCVGGFGLFLVSCAFSQCLVRVTMFNGCMFVFMLAIAHLAFESNHHAFLSFPDRNARDRAYLDAQREMCALFYLKLLRNHF